jgi:aminoglycoside phosphotransferase (APT) family kinase protein
MGNRLLTVSDELAITLVRDQFPHLAEFEIGRHLTFDDHVTVRLGERLCANLPTKIDLDPLVEQSGKWLPAASRTWTFPAGVPLLTGKPTAEYPSHWEVAPWLPGSNATIVKLDEAAGSALGSALSQVHQLPPVDAPLHSTAARPLASLTERWERARGALAASDEPDGPRLDPQVLDSIWGAGVAARPNSAPRWIHGNLDPRYLVSDRGQFRGICTWFTFSAGDPAADIGAACLALPAGGDDSFLEGYGGLDDNTYARACAYRLLRCAEYAASSNPFLARLGSERLEGIRRDS